MQDFSNLSSLGWRPFFQQQLSLEEYDTATAARVVAQHRSIIEVACGQVSLQLAVEPNMPPLAVGDWVLLDSQGRFSRSLDRQSCFRRRAAGSKVAEQVLAANVDVAFVVSSMNDDLNLSRIERYLSLVREAGAEAVVVLTKMDQCADPAAMRSAVQALDSSLCVETVNALCTDSCDSLRAWCTPGRTIVLLGSSGVGKSTLGNTLSGRQAQRTGEARADDDKGRHTTTSRVLLSLPGGAMILDTPGMRELQLSDCEAGLSAAFADIEALATACRFGDCRHETEPGCAVLAALESGELEARRLRNYRKLCREQAQNSATLSQRRANARARGKHSKRIQAERRKLLRQ